MCPCFPKSVSYFPSNPYIAPLNPEDIEKIFTMYITSCQPLRYCICLYLKEFCQESNKNLRAINDSLVYPLSQHDLDMFFMGCDAPLSLIVASAFINDSRFNEMLSNVSLPPDIEGRPNRYARQFNSNICCRVLEISKLINPLDESSIADIFDYICDEKPFFCQEEYFVAGCAASQVLYKKAVNEVNTRLGMKGLFNI